MDNERDRDPIEIFCPPALFDPVGAISLCGSDFQIAIPRVVCRSNLQVATPRSSGAECQ